MNSVSSGPTITVVITTYNRANLVGRAIRSVMNQTYQNFEIIIVDDGSMDNTEEVIRSLHDARIRYIRHDRNKGLASAGRNTGIHAARGRYIAFLDDDDEWRPEKLKRQLDAIQHWDAVLCAALINNEKIKCHKRSFVSINDLRSGSDFDPSSLMAKTSVLTELPFDEALRVGEDWDAFIRIARKYRIGYVSEPLLIYHEAHQGRISSESVNMSIAETEKRMAMLFKHRDFFGKYWLNFHVTRYLLSYWSRRTDKLERLAYTIRRCGMLPVLGFALDKLRRVV